MKKKDEKKNKIGKDRYNKINVMIKQFYETFYSY